MKFCLYLGSLLFALSSFANACSCIDQKLPMSEILAKNDAVFTGKAIKKSSEKLIGSQFDVVEFRIAENYKSASAKSVLVKTANQSAACGFPFEEGETYLVFAYTFPDEKKSSDAKVQYGTGLCSKTKAIKYAETDLQELNKLKNAAH